MAKYDIKEITAKSGSGKAVVEAFFTKKEDALYAVCPNWPGDMLLLEMDEPTDETSVIMLGHEDKLRWMYVDGKVVVGLSQISVNDLPCRYGYTFKISVPKAD